MSSDLLIRKQSYIWKGFIENHEKLYYLENKYVCIKKLYNQNIDSYIHLL